MAGKKSILDKMRSNPLADWTMQDIKTLAKQEDLELRCPKRGSHYVVSSPALRDSVTVPHNRPIKPKYIRLLVGYVDTHREVKKGANE